MEEVNDVLFVKLARVAELIHRLHHRNRRAHGPTGDPHRGQGRVMAMLMMKPQISQKELSYLLDIRPQSLGELLGKLERSGFITRSPSPADRRGMDITLTDAGQEAARQVAAPEPIFSSLSEEETATVSSYLDRMIADLENALDQREESMEWDHGRPGHGPHGHGRRCMHGGHGPHDCDHDDDDDPRGRIRGHGCSHRHDQPYSHDMMDDPRHSGHGPRGGKCHGEDDREKCRHRGHGGHDARRGRDDFEPDDE